MNCEGNNVFSDDIPQLKDPPELLLPRYSCYQDTTGTNKNNENETNEKN